MVAYGLAAWRCLRLARVAMVDSAAGEATGWRISGAVLMALGVYKLFDIQTALGAWGRSVASAQDWYAGRRPVQLAVIGFLAAATGLGGGLAVWSVRRAPPPTRTAVAGVVALVGFVAIRTVSFHDVDRLLDVGLAGLKLNWLIELGGILTILIATRRRQTAARRAMGAEKE